MNADDTPTSDPSGDSPSDEGLPEVEDAYERDGVEGDEVAEDDPQLLDASVRTLQGSDGERSAQAGEAESRLEAVAADDTSDTETIEGDNGSAETDVEPRLPNWDREVSARKIIVELKRVESHVREILDRVDNKRKRKLGGTRRWRDLEEDAVAWRYTHRADNASLLRLHELINRRHYLFRRLRFVAGTRPTWNS